MADKSQKPSTLPVTSNRGPKETKRPQKHQVKQEGKVYVAHPQPAAVAESAPPKSRNKHIKNAAQGCKVACTLCSTMHYVFQCRLFQDMTVQQRKAHVQSSSLCSNCLRSGHSMSDCLSSFRCRICKQQHNTLDSTATPVTVNKVLPESPVDSTKPQEKEKLMMTSKVILTGPSGSKQ